jgi:hypothetical protein
MRTRQIGITGRKTTMKGNAIRSRLSLLGMLLAVPGLAATASVTRAQETAPAQAALTLAVHADEATTVAELLDPDAAAWREAAAQPLHLSRTPPLYAGDPLDDDARPTATVRLARIATGDLVARLHWSDASRDEPGHGRRYPDAGEAHIYTTHTEATNAFGDAACAMVPVRRGPASAYPTLMMGDGAQPVELYYWRAGLGFQLLSGHGRASTGPAGLAGSAAMGRAVYGDGGWTVTLAIPDASPRTPVCFAIWDGAREQRDGIKYFTVWYEVE